MDAFIYAIGVEGVGRVAAKDLAARFQSMQNLRAATYDDLIGLEDGENINPVLLEAQLQVNGADRVCLVRGHGGVMLIASVQGVFSDTQLKSIYAQLQAQLLETKLSASVKKILFTQILFLEN